MFLTRDKDALQKRIQGACKWPRHARAFPVGLTYGSLAVDDDRCLSNEIECLAHEYHDVFTILSAFFFSCYFAPSQTWEPDLDNVPSELLGRLVAMPALPSPSPQIFKQLPHVEVVSRAFDDTCSSARS